MASSFKRGRCLLGPLRRRNKMSQQDLALILKVSRQLISQYENNEIPIPIERGKNLAFLLDCIIDDLYEWIEE